MTPIIEVKNLSKKYRIGEQQPYLTLRDTLAGLVKNPFKAVKEGLNKDEFWALKDINFTVEPGEVIGIIGRNGAGKSTLLKILSRITPPTTGEITLRGRVGSLLEVGTGFQQELTGRENIFLNGAILGMTQREIKRKFEEIVNFAEVEKFIDTPVKHYSSGMYMRLAFSIAAHLDPEILIVDEVLAVGDIAFQEKSFGKMESISKNEGKTIILVSHNANAMQALCSKAMLLDHGKILNLGDIKTVIENYEDSIDVGSHNLIWRYNKRRYDELPLTYIKKIWLTNLYNKTKLKYKNSETVVINMELIISKLEKDIKIGFDLYRQGNVVFRTQNIDTNKIKLKKGNNFIKCHIPSNLLNAGFYSIKPIFTVHNKKEIQGFDKTILTFQVEIDCLKSIYHAQLNQNNNPGIIFPQLNWSSE